MDLKETECPRVSTYGHPALHILLRKTITRGDGETGLVQAVDPRFEVPNGKGERVVICWLVGRKFRKVLLNDLQAALKKLAETGLDVVFPIPVESAITAAGGAGKQAVVSLHIIGGLGTHWNLGKQFDPKKVEFANGDSLFVEADDGHGKIESRGRCVGRRIFDLRPSTFNLFITVSFPA